MEPRDKRELVERQPALIRGGRPLLFERLCMHPESADAGSLRSSELRALGDSIMRELTNLLNTRLPFGAGLSDESTQTVVNYGLPDFSTLNTVSPADRALLARLIEQKIAAFEPRLRDVRVMLEQDPVSRRALVGTMSGDLKLASISERVTFPVALGESGVTVRDANYAG